MIHLGIDATNIRQGGGLTHLSRLLAAGDPQAAGIDRVTVFAGADTLAQMPTRPWLHAQTQRWMDAALPLRALGQQLLLPAALRSAHCDVLFSPGATLPMWCPVPAISMSQNMLPFEPLEAARFGTWSSMRLKMRLLRYSQGKSFRRAQGLVFLTRYAQQAVNAALGAIPGAQALVPHGIEPRFVQAPRAPRPLSACSVVDPFRVLYVSIAMPYKRQVEVAQAVAALRSQGMPIEVHFVGAPHGKYGRTLRTVLDQLDPQRRFLLWSGAVPFELLHQHYQQADAFVFASSCENLPNILIEAMAAGLPIASSNRGPMPEVLGDAGVYFDPDSPEAIADALRRLATDDQLRLGLAQRAWRQAQDYSWDRCARETFGFIAQVVQQGFERQGQP